MATSSDDDVGKKETDGTAEEVWAVAIGWPEYEVSTFGNVRRIGKIDLVKVLSHKDYPVVGLHGPGRRAAEMIHRMVALAHIPNPTPTITIYVNHINGNKQDCRAVNLEWVTPRENIHHAIRTGLVTFDGHRGVKVVSRDPTTGVEVVYNSMKEAAKAVGVLKLRFETCIEDSRHMTAGLYWRLHEDAIGKSKNWRPLMHCDGYSMTRVRYEVSDLGEIRKMKNAKLLHPVTFRGYCTIHLTVDSQVKRRPFLIHRLIAATFLPAPDGPSQGFDVDHINGSNTDNRSANLQWLTREKHSEKTFGRRVLQLTTDGVIVARFDSIKAAAKSIGTAYHTMWRIVNRSGKPLSCGGYRWAYDTDCSHSSQLLIKESSTKDDNSSTLRVPVYEMDRYIDWLLTPEIPVNEMDSFIDEIFASGVPLSEMESYIDDLLSA